MVENKQHTATWWLIGIGTVLLVLGFWLAAHTMKRRDMRKLHSPITNYAGQAIRRG